MRRGKTNSDNREDREERDIGRVILFPPLRIYKKLYSYFGPLGWWPGDSKFEILVGAILTQQTSWGNVEKAIANLKGAGLMGLGQISSCSERKLAGLIRPSGYYRQKAKRLRGICRGIAAAYGTLEGMFRLERGELRRALLGMKGIGNETADSIILYAAEKPIFVIDAYTERVMKRLSGRESAIGYTELQAYFTRNMAEDLDRYKEAHAQFVELGKRYCRPVPLCGGCPLRKWCAYPKAARAARTAHLDDAKG